MKLSYDRESDALYVRFGNAPIIESEELRAGVILDFDAGGRIVAIEILDAREQLTPEALVGLAAA